MQGSAQSRTGFQAAWVDIGAPFGGDPTLVSWGSGRVDFFARNSGNQLVQKTWVDGNGWAPTNVTNDAYWYLTSDVASTPAAVGWGGNRIDVVFHNPAGQLIHFYWDGARWTTQNLDGWSEGRPSISVASDGTRMDVFARVGNSVWHRGWMTGFSDFPNFAGWEPLDITVDSDPVAIQWGTGKIDIFYRDANGQTQRYSRDGGPASPNLRGQFKKQQSLGGYAKGSPAVVSRAPGSLDVFVQGGDDGIYRNSLNAFSGAFDGFKASGGATYGTPAVAMSDTLHIVVRDPNTRRVFHNHESMFPSTAAGDVPVACGNAGQHYCVATGCEAGLGPDPSTGKCAQCGYVEMPVCTASPGCYQGAPESGLCVMSYDDGTSLVAVCEGQDLMWFHSACVHCGNDDEPPCPGKSCPKSDHILNGQGLCVQCGDVNQPACASDWEPCPGADHTTHPGKEVQIVKGICSLVDYQPPPPPPQKPLPSDPKGCGKSDYSPCCNRTAACSGGRFCNSEHKCQPSFGGGGSNGNGNLVCVTLQDDACVNADGSPSQIMGHGAEHLEACGATRDAAIASAKASFIQNWGCLSDNPQPGCCTYDIQ